MTEINFIGKMIVILTTVNNKKKHLKLKQLIFQVDDCRQSYLRPTGLKHIFKRMGLVYNTNLLLYIRVKSYVLLARQKHLNITILTSVKKSRLNFQRCHKN